MKMPAHTRFAVALVAYLTGIFGILAPRIASSTGGERLEWAFAAVTLTLYAVCTLLALWRKAGDPRVVLFMYTLLASGATLVLRFRPLDPHPASGDFLHLAAVCVIFVGVGALALHMAALIPRRNPIVVRHPWMIWGSYAAAGVLAAVAFAWELDAALHFFPWAVHFPPRLVLISIVRTFWALAGWLSLYLYASAAKHDESTAGRRQALVVFGGILPWTLNVTATFVPA